jgi:hypothetical protein
MLSVVFVFGFALGTVAQADPPNLSIQQQATLFTGGVLVTVVVNCGDGPSLGEVEVAVRQGNLAFSGIEVFDSSGLRREVSVEIPGIFSAGDAVASAALECAGLAEGLVLGETILISQ